MPNWCYSFYHFRGNKDNITEFRNKLCKWTDEPGIHNGFGHNWLGNILYRAGMSETVAYNCPKDFYIPHRGCITDISELFNTDSGLSFTVSTETAWCPMPDIFREIIRHLEYDIDFAFQAEESGSEVYEIYDPEDWGVFEENEMYAEYFFNDEDAVFKMYPYLKIFDSERYFSAYSIDNWLNENELTIETVNSLQFDDSDDYFHLYHFKYVDDPFVRP